MTRPSWEEGWWWLGRLYYEQDRFPEARDALANFVSRSSSPGAAFALLGLCEYETRDYARSLEHFKLWAAAGVPGSKDLVEVASFHWALLLTRKGDYGRALELLLGRAKIRGENPVLIEALGLAALRIPSLPEDYSPQLRERVWLAGKAEYFTIAQDYARAQEYSRRLISAYSEQPNVHFFQGTLLNAQRRTTEADAEFRRELQIDPKNTAAMVELAQLALDAGETDEAERWSKNATQLAPTDPLAHRILGAALLAAGKPSESIYELESAKKLDPSDAKVRFYLAGAYRRAGRSGDAQREEAEFQTMMKRRNAAFPPDREPRQENGTGGQR